MVVIVRRHARFPPNMRTSRGAIWSSGSTAEHKPACATEPGMPHTTLLGGLAVSLTGVYLAIRRIRSDAAVLFRRTSNAGGTESRVPS